MKLYCTVLYYSVRENLRTAKKDFSKTVDDLKYLRSTGLGVAEVVKPLDNERGKHMCLYAQYHV